MSAECIAMLSVCTFVIGNNKVRAGSEKVAMVSIVWANTHITLPSSKSFGDLLASLVPVNLFGQRHSVNGDISLRRQRKPFLAVQNSSIGDLVTN